MNGSASLKLGFRHANAWEAPVYRGLEERILHIYHTEWWGIRSATELLPGATIGISAYSPFERKRVLDEIRQRGIAQVVFQGYSQNAADLAEYLHTSRNHQFEINVVTHVSPAQFDNQFEIEMLAIMVNQKQRGVVDRLWSVKPGFDGTCREFESLLLVNTLPPWRLNSKERQTSAALIPLTRGLRKNMQANHIALANSSYDVIFSTLHSADLMGIANEAKIRFIGHVPQTVVRDIMGAVGLVSNVTLIECQPMVFNEAVSVGTPCLTGPLYLPFCSDHPLRELTEIREPDNVRKIRSKAEEIKSLWQENPGRISEMCQDYHQLVTVLSAETYTEAFGG
ncbi:hypothetical protein LJR257_004751 [Ensifer adhaerens]